MTIAVSGEGVGFDAIAVAADFVSLSTNSLINIITEEQHDVGMFLRQMPIGREIAVFKVGAGHKAKSQPIWLAVRGGQGKRPANAALRRSAAESVPIGTSRRETGYIHVDSMGKRGIGQNSSTPDDLAHRI